MNDLSLGMECVPCDEWPSNEAGVPVPSDAWTTVHVLRDTPGPEGIP